MRLIATLLLVLAASPALPDDFWAHWGDGKAELNGYKIVQPRYGEKRDGIGVLVFVTEEMSDSLRVKADPGKHPASDVYPVMKLNDVLHFQTGIYDYSVMTSTFARVSPGWPVSKVSFSSQEWCGHVYHQILPRPGAVPGVFHSYFDGEADGKDELGFPKDGVFEDALPILLRGWGMAYMQPGETRSVPILPTLLRSRLQHKPLAWSRATITRAAGTEMVAVPAGKYKVTTWTVAIEGGPKLTFQFEAEAPYRLVHRSTDTGEDAQLLGSARLAYWKMNNVGGESALKLLGLKPR
jgi:hypothetical protein